VRAVRLLIGLLCLAELALLGGAILGVRNCDIAAVVGFVVIETLLPEPVEMRRVG
jgi:hypothetical protein